MPKSLANGVGNKFVVGVQVGWEHSCVASLEGNQVFCWGGSKHKPGMAKKALIEPGCVAMCTGCVGAGASLRPRLAVVILGLVAGLVVGPLPRLS